MVPDAGNTQYVPVIDTDDEVAAGGAHTAELLFSSFWCINPSSVHFQEK